MILFRRRLLFWLVKAYIKKSGKRIVLSFFLGLIIFLAFLAGIKYIPKTFPLARQHIIGVAGVYTIESFPSFISESLSRGLTRVTADSRVHPSIATSWEIEDIGKSYLFHIKKGLYFSDGTPLTSKTIQYSFKDVKIERIDDYTIRFTLKDAYSPFLVTISTPIFKNGLIGTNNSRVRDLDLNGNFIKGMSVQDFDNKQGRTAFKFYPSEEALKIAFSLGEITEAVGLKDDKFKGHAFSDSKSVSSKRTTDYKLLVSLFFNTQDSILSDKKVRAGLSYALPDDFKEGENAFLPFPPRSIYFNRTLASRQKDNQHAKLLLDSVLGDASSSSSANLTIKTLAKYKDAAQEVSDSWKDVGINAKIEIVDRIPDNFQIYLGDINLPKDPDQYTLWHSAQANNITKFKNLRIDKLLEDGRKVSSVEERIKIYDDFQKYLLEESPALFLYFPYSYTITRN